MTGQWGGQPLRGATPPGERPGGMPSDAGPSCSGDRPARASHPLSRRTFLAGLALAPAVGAFAWATASAPGARVLPKTAPLAKTTGADSLADGWLPAPAAMPGSLLEVGLEGLGQDTQASLAILQGLVNARARAGGQAVFLLVPSSYPGGVAVPGTDQRWAELYAADYGISISQGTPSDVVAAAERSGVGQYVIWDPTVPATINVANTLAWLRGVAAFSPTDAASSLPGGMKLALDLRQLHFATEGDAYRWALGQLATTAPASLALLSVGDLTPALDPTLTETVLRWTPRDYAVLTRAFTFEADLQRVAFGTGAPDLDLLERIVATVSADKATMFGWSNDESAQTILASRHSIVFTAADTPGLPAENLSVHSAIRTTAVQRPRPEAPALDAAKVYATVVFTDGDNIGVLTDFHEGRWLDSSRGQVPVGWSMQGMAPSWTPGVARYYFDTATPNDEMVSWLPFGYPDLASFVDRKRWPEYVASAQQATSSAGLSVTQSLPHLPIVYSERASGLWGLLHGPTPPSGHLLGYTQPIGLYPVGEPLWVNGRPVLPVGGYDRSGTTKVAENVAAVDNAAAANLARPLFVAVGLDNLTTYADAVATVQGAYGAAVEFVLPSQLVELMHAAWSSGHARTTLLGLQTTTNLDAYFLVGGDGGSHPTLAGEGATWTQARSVADGASWAYRFNVEQCRDASLTLAAVGAGTIAASSDGHRWRTVAEVATQPGSQALVDADLGGLLPAPHLWVRFTATSAGALTITSLALHYNRAGAPGGLPAPVSSSALPSGWSVLAPTSGVNLAASAPPGTLGGLGISDAAGGPAGTYTIGFPVDPTGETMGGGYGGTDWVGWAPGGLQPGHTYLFRLEDVTGCGKLYLDVFDGEADLASQQLELSPTPQTLSLLVTLPTSVPPGSPAVEFQARTDDFLTSAAVMPSAYLVR